MSRSMGAGCAGCRPDPEAGPGAGLGFELAMAFQPILDIAAGGAVLAQEALVRGPDGQGADWVIAQVTPETL